MANYSQLLRIHSNKPISLPTAVRRSRELLKLFRNFITGPGANRIEAVNLITNGEGDVRASQTVTFASSSGTVGVVAGGVTTTVTWATADAGSMTLLTTAFNAVTNALVQYLLKMSNTGGLFTLSTMVAGNKVKVGEFEFTCVASGMAKKYGEFEVAASDTLTAVNLAAAINSHPLCSINFGAVSAAAVVTVYTFGTPSSGGTALIDNSGTATVTAAAALAVGLIRAQLGGRMANHVTIAASGTNVSVGAARMTGGAGGNAVAISGGGF